MGEVMLNLDFFPRRKALTILRELCCSYVDVYFEIER